MSDSLADAIGPAAPPRARAGWVARLKRLGKWLVASALLGAVALVLLLGLLWLEHGQELELPRPTGPFAVGRLGMAWVDASRADPFASSPDQKREVIAWLWYPAPPDPQAKPAAYLPRPWADALAEHAGVLLTTFLNRDPSRVRTHCVDDARLAPDWSKYPVVVLRSGIGALALDYTTLAEDLASHGYVVLGADVPYSTSVVVLPGGRTIHKTTAGNPGDAPLSASERDRLLAALLRVWSTDTSFLVDQLTRLADEDPAGRFAGRLDLERLAVIGHSFGGATAAQFCHDDTRCKAGIDIDGAPYGSVVQEGLRQPFLFLLSDHGEAWDAPDCRICADIRAVANRIPGDRLIVTLRGAHHFSFSDQAMVKSQLVLKVLRALGIAGDLGSADGLMYTSRYVREFLDVHLRGAPREKLYGAPLMAAARFETK